jgi:hypothetical protein
MKTIYEKNDVSQFRKYAREKRFQQPVYEEKLKLLLERIEKRNAPPIMLVKAKRKNSERETIDSISVGKTDFCYFIAHFCRQTDPQIKVLAFPDIVNRIERGSTFYSSVFVPELLRLTRSFTDELFKAFILAKTFLLSILKRFLLLIRINVRIAITLAAFILARVSLEFAFAHQTEFVNELSKISLPVLLVATLLWVVYVWDKVEKEYLVQWQDSAFRNLLRITKIENSYISPEQLMNRFNARDKIIIIIDDASQIDSESLGHLVSIVTDIPSKQKRQSHSHIGLILLSDKVTNEQHPSATYLSEFRCKLNNWLSLDIYPPTLDEIEWLLSGVYGRKSWNRVKQLIEDIPEITKNIGILLQFLYDETRILELENHTILDIDYGKLLTDYLSFTNDYILQAEQIFERIPEENREIAKEFIKYILAFEVPLPNIEKIRALLRKDGHQHIESIEHILVEKKLVKVYDGSYVFCDPSEQNILLLGWTEWRDNAQKYYSKVFNFLHEFSSAKDNPLLAKKCEPSLLIVDVLWREGDVLWFFGGHGNAYTALSYYGLETGALGKWFQIFEEKVRENKLTKDDYLWLAKTKSKGSHFESFIGNLFQVCAALYFVAGEYQKSFYILDELWDKVKNAYWATAKSSDRKINQIMLETEVKVKIQLLFYALNGPARKEYVTYVRDIFSALKSTSNNNTSQPYSDWLNALEWKYNYLKIYGIGNLTTSLSNKVFNSERLCDLWLIHSPVTDPANARLAIGKFGTAKYIVLLLYIQHLLDYFDWVNNQGGNEDTSSAIENLISLVNAFEEQISHLERKLNKSLKNFVVTGLDDAFPLPDLDITILNLKGWLQLYKAQELYLQYSKLLSNMDSENDHAKEEYLRRAIEDFYNITQILKKDEAVMSTSLQEVMKQAQSIYNQYLQHLETEDTKRIYLQKTYKELRETTIQMLKVSQQAHLDAALKAFNIAKDTASLRGIKHDEVISIYALILISKYISSDNSLLLKLIEDAQQILPFPIQGNRVDSLLVYIHLAKLENEFTFESGYSHIEKARDICDHIDGLLPPIIKGKIIADEIFLLTSTQTNLEENARRALDLANSALEIYKVCLSNTVLSKAIKNLEGLVRWMAAECCFRLALVGNDLNKYYSIAQNHCNWIAQHFQDISQEATEKLVYVKTHQILGTFLFLRGEYEHALYEMQIALKEVEQLNLSLETRILEQIQTLSIIVMLMYNHTPFSRELSRYLAILRQKLLIGMELSSSRRRDRIHWATIKGATLYGHIMGGTYSNPQMWKDAIDLLLYGVEGFIEWGEINIAVTELDILEKLLKRCPFKDPALPTIEEKASALIKKCAARWERNGNWEIYEILSNLTKKSVNRERSLPESKNKKNTMELIANCRKLMSYPEADLAQIYKRLVDALDQVEFDNPSYGDMELMQLLLECSSAEKDFEKVQEIHNLFKKLSLSYAGKIYLEVAKAFSKFPEIEEKYLRLAASTGQNKFSNEASFLISQKVNRSGIRKSDYAKDESEKINYTRLVNLPDSQYDITEAFNLFFLLENELRRLIGYQFDRHRWWNKGIPSDMHEHVSKESKEQLKGIELLKMLTLGDLFRIIKSRDNWEQIFQTIFLSISNVESREEIILPFRNKLTRTDPDITQNEIKEFVAVTKSIISRIQPYLPE